MEDTITEVGNSRLKAAIIGAPAAAAAETSAAPSMLRVTDPRSVSLSNGSWGGGRLRGTRASVLAQLDQSGLSAAHKAVVAAELALIPAEYDLLEVHFHRQDYKAGANWCCTVSELGG